VKPENITDTIVQLKVPMSRNPLGKTFSYLLKESRTLIDTGVPSDEAYNGLKPHGLKPKDIERVIITHLHNDHIGLVERLRDYGAEIWAGDRARKRQEMMVAEWDNLYENTLKELDLFGGQQYRNNITKNKYIFKSDVKPMPIDRYLADGEKITLGDLNLEVIWTPGHSYEHICLLDQKDRILLFCQRSPATLHSTATGTMIHSVSTFRAWKRFRKWTLTPSCPATSGRSTT